MLFRQLPGTARSRGRSRRGSVHRQAAGRHGPGRVRQDQGQDRSRRVRPLGARRTAMTSRVISGGEFAGLFPEARRSIFRMEDQRNPLTAEQAAYERFLHGAPLLPPEWPEWQAWLNKVRGLARQGTLVSRIIIIDDPVAPYQQWRMWAGSWHRQAGEGILFLPRRKADTLGIRGNWCLF